MNEAQLTRLRNAAEALEDLIEAISQAEDAGSYVAAIDRAVENIRVAANRVVNTWTARQNQCTDHTPTHIRRLTR